MVKERGSKRWEVWVTFEKNVKFEFDKPVKESELKAAVDDAFCRRGKTVICGDNDQIKIESPIKIDKNGKEMR